MAIRDEVEELQDTENIDTLSRYIITPHAAYTNGLLDIFTYVKINTATGHPADPIYG